MKTTNNLQSLETWWNTEVFKLTNLKKAMDQIYKIMIFGSEFRMLLYSTYANFSKFPFSKFWAENNKLLHFLLNPGCITLVVCYSEDSTFFSSWSVESNFDWMRSGFFGGPHDVIVLRPSDQVVLWMQKIFSCSSASTPKSPPTSPNHKASLEFWSWNVRLRARRYIVTDEVRLSTEEEFSSRSSLTKSWLFYVQNQMISGDTRWYQMY